MKRLNRLLMLVVVTVVVTVAVTVAVVASSRAMAVEPTQNTKTSIGFYNLENVYDTIPSIFYDDTDYTPQGKNAWAAERYTRKLQNLAQVIDELFLDVLGICEVENEAVVQDLVRSLKTDYNYIHRTTADRRGMDIALLYKGDKFVPQTVRQLPSTTTREFLYVRGELLGERIDLIVCHLPSNFNSTKVRERVLLRLAATVDSITIASPDARPIIMGDFNLNPSDKLMIKQFGSNRNLMEGRRFMFNPFYRLHQKGYGTYVYGDRWDFIDNIILSSSFLGGNKLTYHSCGVFVRDYMLDNGKNQKQGYPKRTFVTGKYVGGYSDHLPVFLFLQK